MKSKELEEIIAAVSGLYLEASAEGPNTNPGNSFKVQIEALNRSDQPMTLKSVSISGTMATEKDMALEENQKKNLELELQVAENTSYTSPYWLAKKGSLGMYRVDDRELIGNPETPRAFHAKFSMDFGGSTVVFTRPVVYRHSKPDKGELYKPFEVLPPASASFSG